MDSQTNENFIDDQVGSFVRKIIVAVKNRRE